MFHLFFTLNILFWLWIRNIVAEFYSLADPLEGLII